MACFLFKVRQLESPELTEVSPFVVEDTTASTSAAASRPSTRLRIRRGGGGHSSDDDGGGGGDLNLIPLKPVSALKNDQDQDGASLASLGSFFAVKAFKHNKDGKDEGDANTVINELFCKDIVKDTTQPHISDTSSATATAQQKQQSKFFHGAPKSAATVDEGKLNTELNTSNANVYLVIDKVTLQLMSNSSAFFTLVIFGRK